MKKKSVLSLLLAAALALSLAGCAGQGQPGGKEPVVNSDGTITKEENDVKITETAARSIETELYWTVTSGGTAMYHSIRVQDPSQPLNQMFVLLKAEGLLHSQEGKDAYAYNVTMGNTWAQMLSQAPVLTTPSTENFFKLFSEYAATALPRPASCPRMLWEKRRCGRPLPKTARRARGCSPRRWWTSEALILPQDRRRAISSPGRTAATTWHTTSWRSPPRRIPSSNGRASSPWNARLF